MDSEYLSFQHPEPPKTKIRLHPVFLPFAGCPFRCIYCSQKLQTGTDMLAAEKTAREVFAFLSSNFTRSRKPVSLGFFGGTFTAMPLKDQLLLLNMAHELKKLGAVEHVRCSTRPDCVDEKTIILLKSYKMDMIELGIQSFDGRSLAGSRRGYTGAQALAAADRIKKAGLELGIQLMPGLPGSRASAFLKDTEITSGLKPAAVRLYPCLVVQDTPLAVLWNENKFQPWNLKKTQSLISKALLRFWSRNIPVIRIGLAPENSLLSGILAGPWHPALGSICRSQALATYILARTAGKKIKQIFVPGRYQSDFWGFKKKNSSVFLKRGISTENVRLSQGELFELVFEPNRF